MPALRQREGDPSRRRGICASSCTVRAVDVADARFDAPATFIARDVAVDTADRGPLVVVGAGRRRVDALTRDALHRAEGLLVGRCASRASRGQRGGGHQRVFGLAAARELRALGERVVDPALQCSPCPCPPEPSAKTGLALSRQRQFARQRRRRRRRRHRRSSRRRSGARWTCRSAPVGRSSRRPRR